MASIWNKTLFYLGLVDDEQGTEAMERAGEAHQPGQPGAAPRQPEPYVAPTSSVAPPGAVVSGRRVEPPASTARTISSDRTHAEAGVFIHQDGVPAGRADGPARRSEPESQVIVARNFSDAQTLADSIRMGRTVVLDLRSTEPEMVRRIVDFASGLTYALDGRMAKTAQGVILVTPAGSSLGVGEQERLARIGLFGSSS
ncbi:MAG: cell division protein SepF [Actinomycetota bacterium]